MASITIYKHLGSAKGSIIFEFPSPLPLPALPAALQQLLPQPGPPANHQGRYSKLYLQRLHLSLGLDLKLGLDLDLNLELDLELDTGLTLAQVLAYFTLSLSISLTCCH